MIMRSLRAAALLGLALCQVLWSLAAVGQTPAAGPGPVIAAASDLKFALDELIALFRTETGLALRVSYGSSGHFYSQIRQDAPFQLFLSADEDFVHRLADQGIVPDRGVLYAIGRLALYAPHGSPVLPDTEFADLRRALADGRVTRFAIANPEHAPYGRAAREALERADLWAVLAPRLVLGENVSQAAQFAASGSAQAGLIALSLAVAPAFAKAGTHVVVPESVHSPLRQRMVLTRKAGDTARRFYQYLQSPPARLVLARYGFVPPAEPLR